MTQVLLKLQFFQWSVQPQTNIQLYERVLGGTDEALFEREVDLAISSHIPQGFSGEPG